MDHRPELILGFPFTQGGRATPYILCPRHLAYLTLVPAPHLTHLPTSASPQIPSGSSSWCGPHHSVLFSLVISADFTAILRTHPDHRHGRVTASVSPSTHLHMTLRGAPGNTSLGVPLLCCKRTHSLGGQHPSDRPGGFPSLPVSSYRGVPVPHGVLSSPPAPRTCQPFHHAALSLPTPHPPGKPLLLQRRSSSILGPFL